MYDEWRVTVCVKGEQVDRDKVVEQTRLVAAEDVAVHRRGRSELLIYAFTREEAEDTQGVVRDLLTDGHASATYTLHRWNPGKECWQGPALPVEPPAQALAPEWLDLTELAWEVRLRFRSWYDRQNLEQDLRADGHPLVSDGWKRLTIGVADEPTARVLEAELRGTVKDASIEVRPMSRWRRWLIRQGLGGNYARGGATGSAGDIGGGNGGGNGGGG